jgi:hypothetical protein
MICCQDGGGGGLVLAYFVSPNKDQLYEKIFKIKIKNKIIQMEIVKEKAFIFTIIL